MDREIKNNGEYMEVDADSIFDKLDQMEKSDVLVIKKSRIELSGVDKDIVVGKFRSYIEKYSDKMASYSSSQKSDFLLRKLFL